MPEHRVELVQLLDPLQERAFVLELVPVLAGRFHPRDLHHQLFALRQELVQRRIDRPDGDRQAAASP